jgi:hypothetical protein
MSTAMKQRFGLIEGPWGVWYAKYRLTGNSESGRLASGRGRGGSVSLSGA